MAKFKLEMCSGTSCHLMGSTDLYHVLDTLDCQYKEYLEIIALPCLGMCGHGPNIRFNGEIYTHVTPEELIKIIKKQIGEKRGGEDGCY